jgi:hypothetical protein
MRSELEAEGLKIRPSALWRLYFLGVDSIEKLADLRVSELMLQRDIGITTVNNIRAFLQSKGLDLKD